MDLKTNMVFGALFGVALISAFAYALPSSDRGSDFGWMMGGASQNAFGMDMMGRLQDGGFGMKGGMMGNNPAQGRMANFSGGFPFGMMAQAGNGFNFSAMHGGKDFGMMGGNKRFGMMGNGGFGMMMGNWNGTGFNASAMLIIHNQMHGTNLTAEEFANLHRGFGNATINNSSSSFGCPMHSGKFGDFDGDEDEKGRNSNGMAQHHAAMHGGNGFGMMGNRRNH